MAKTEDDWTAQQEINWTEEVDRSDGEEWGADQWVRFDIQAWKFCMTLICHRAFLKKLFCRTAYSCTPSLWHHSHCVSLPVKRIVQSPLVEVVMGCTWTIRWSWRKHYTAIVLFLGRNSAKGRFSLIFTFSYCPSGNAASVARIKARMGIIKLQW